MRLCAREGLVFVPCCRRQRQGSAHGRRPAVASGEKGGFTGPLNEKVQERQITQSPHNTLSNSTSNYYGDFEFVFYVERPMFVIASVTERKWSLFACAVIVLHFWAQGRLPTSFLLFLLLALSLHCRLHGAAHLAGFVIADRPLPRHLHKLGKQAQ